MTTEGNDIDRDITLSCFDPPTFGQRKLLWSGDRIPEIGETVTVKEFTYTGVVTSYFQAHGWLGVIVDWVGACFGQEIVVGVEPQKETVN